MNISAPLLHRLTHASHMKTEGEIVTGSRTDTQKTEKREIGIVTETEAQTVTRK